MAALGSCFLRSSRLSLRQACSRSSGWHDVKSNLNLLPRHGSVYWNVLLNASAVPSRQRMWSTRHRDSTVNREELARPLPEDDERRFHPIIAARNDQTTAARYDPLVEKFINIIMKDGKRILARDIMDKTLESVKRAQLERYHGAPTAQEREGVTLDARQVLHAAVANCRPLLWLSNIQKGGVVYQVPVAIHADMQRFRAIKFLVEAANDKDRKLRLHVTLGREVVAAAANEGKAVRRKQEVHRQCEANRAYAHFRWAKR